MQDRSWAMSATESTLMDPLDRPNPDESGPHPVASLRAEHPSSGIGAADCAFTTPATYASTRHAKRHVDRRSGVTSDEKSVMWTSQSGCRHGLARAYTGPRQ